MSNDANVRKTLVKGVDIKLRKPDEFLSPPDEVFEGRPIPGEAWTVMLTLQTGLLPESTSFVFFDTKNEVDKFIAEHPVGSEYDDNVPFLTKSIVEKGGFDNLIGTGWFPIAAGSPSSYFAEQVLIDEGISDKNGLWPSEAVLDALGKERVEEIRELYDDNWSYVANFEYCLNELDASSPAYVAAASMFCYWILEEDFKAGYLLRDLEIIVGGVEAEATKAIVTRKKAGALGSKKSAEARVARRNALWVAVEEIVLRNPDISKMGEAMILPLALEKATAINPSLWSQGQGQAKEYLDEIRRGDAKPEMKARYQEIFGTKPLKRL